MPFTLISKMDLVDLGEIPPEDEVTSRLDVICLKCLDSVNSNDTLYLLYSRLELPIEVAPVIKQLTGFNPIYL